MPLNCNKCGEAFDVAELTTYDGGEHLFCEKCCVGLTGAEAGGFDAAKIAKWKDQSGRGNDMSTKKPEQSSWGDRIRAIGDDFGSHGSHALEDRVLELVQEIAQEADNSKQRAQVAERGNTLIQDALRVALQSWSGKALQAPRIEEKITRETIDYERTDRMDSGKWVSERTYSEIEMKTLRDAMKALQQKGKASR